MMHIAAGKNAEVSFDGTMIHIRRTGGGVGLFIQQGIQGNRYIVARTITAVEFREAGKTGNGFIAFDFPGKNPPRGGVFDAAADENAVIFTIDQLETFRALHGAIVGYLVGVNQALDATYSTAAGITGS